MVYNFPEHSDEDLVAEALDQREHTGPFPGAACCILIELLTYKAAPLHAGAPIARSRR